MEFVQVGIIARPHGFRGALVVVDHSGQDSVLGMSEELWIGETPHKVLEASWMPSGWKMQLEGIGSDSEVIALRGQKVFAKGADLPKLEDNNFYLHELIGMEIVDTDEKRTVGKFLNVESCPSSQWWKILYDGQERLIPPKRHFIESVDKSSRQIHLRNLQELP